MFNNLQELVQEIESGKDTQTIVKERLEFLKSDDYQSKVYKGNNSASCEFIQGYISDDTTYGFGGIDTTKYWMDEEKIYEVIIDNLIRKYLDNIKSSNVLPMENLINGVRHYFQHGDPNNESLEVLKQMQREGLSHTAIRENFGQRYNQYLLNRKTDNEYQTLSTKIKECENYGNFISVPISAIKGLNIGECTEMALLSQNVLSFLGYNSFMVEGKSINSLGEQECHNFNAVEKYGKYIVFDSALMFCAIAPEIKTPEDLLIFDNMVLKNGQKEVTYFSNRKSEHYINPQEKMQILSQKGDKYRNSVMADLKNIMISKQLIEHKGEGRDE